jgi:hypothetical protein
MDRVGVEPTTSAGFIDSTSFHLKSQQLWREKTPLFKSHPVNSFFFASPVYPSSSLRENFNKDIEDSED